MTSSAEAPPLSLWGRIKKHKLVEWSLAYVAFAYAALHGSQMLRETLGWSADVPRFTLFALLLGLPIAVTLAWYHGHKAQHRISGPELLIVSLLFAIGGTVLWGFSRPHERASDQTPSKSQAALSSPLAEKSIAVLPFLDLSEKHDQGYFADGLADDLLDLLAKVPGLRVIARTSSFQFKGKEVDLQTIATKLGAPHVLEGSVRRSGDEIRVTAQLIRASDGTHEWSDSYDRKMGDVLLMQREMASAISRVLQVTVQAGQGTSSTVSPAAYELFLRGLQAYERTDFAGFEQAADYFQQALDLEPTYTRAAESLALTHLLEADNQMASTSEGWERVRKDAKRLVSLNKRSLIGHMILARIHTDYDWDWTAAEREADEALAINPHSWHSQYAAAALANALGEWANAESHFRAALTVDPLNPDPHQALGGVLLSAGRFSDAE